MKNFITRTITGIFLILFVIGGFLLHPLSFAVVGIIVVIGSQVELSKILSSGAFSSNIIRSLAISVPAYIISFLIAAGYVDFTALLLIPFMVIIVVISEIYSRGKNHLDAVAQMLFSSFYLSLPFILMLFSAFGSSGKGAIINHGMGQFSPLPVIGFFILLWVNDSAAYLVGVTAGKHRLFERISPKKSWEGLFGGVAFTVVTALLLGEWFGNYTFSDRVIIALLVSVGSTFGDLFESLIKRDAGVKDSGKILPGHGGFLDRFDGVTISFPLVYLYLTFFG